MESGMDFSDGIRVWGDFSWTSAIDAAASVSVILSTLTVGVLNAGLIFFWLRSFYFFAVRRQNGRALKNFLVPPVSMLALYLCFQLGPYALLGFWSALGLAGAGYAIGRRVALWRILRKHPAALGTAEPLSFRKIFFQSGKKVRWLYSELEAPTAEMLEELERRAMRAPAALGVAKPEASV